MRSFSVAVVGATGLVGRTMLTILAERKFPVSSLTLLASKRSAGTTMRFKGKSYKVKELTERSFEGIDIALFSAGSSVSRKYAPIAAKAGCIAIDNSSEWRMATGVPLIVPEVNAAALRRSNGKLASRVIANPNCSTIQMVVALEPLRKKFGLKRVVVSTYQSVTGAGHRGESQLYNELKGTARGESIFPHPVAFNAVFHSFGGGEDYTTEEIKMIKETRKIMGLPRLKITATCVRIPVTGGHSESVNVQLGKSATPTAVAKLLSRSEGIVVVDNPSKNHYPMPIHAEGKDDVFVGRIRRDDSAPNSLNMWVVSDNLRKGAATNAVQIAEALVKMRLV